MAEGKGYSEMYRNTSEDLFLKSLMENSVNMPVPTLDMLGFKNISSHLHHHHNFRVDSEELFKTWLTNGENHDYNPSSIAHRTRQASRRISTDISNSISQQPLQNKSTNDVIVTQNEYQVPETPSSDLNDQSVRYFLNPIEKVVQQTGNLNFAKAWFHSSQPMTRSRSSELRKRYAAMQSAQTSTGNGPSNLSQEFADPVAPQIGDLDQVSSVVSMLKGTLERKKIGNQTEKNSPEDSYNAIYNHTQQVLPNPSFDPENENHSILEIPQSFQITDGGGFQIVQGTAEFDLEGFVNPANPIHQMSIVSREPSQSESSAAAPCDGPSISSSRKAVENNGSEKGPQAKDFRERIIENLKDDRKRGGLVRYGSMTSIGSVDKGDPTKKRRVERSRKMAEAKERNSTPAIPSDMQSVLKRCENLEKEVRSLKLNLSFMNRKDSEQTKQIEELQKQNEDLADEKERLLEEIERILSQTGKI